VAILAVTHRDEVVLARQFRPGPGRVLDEMPGGYVDEGESAIVACERELLEETGYTGDFELAGRSWLASSALTRRHVVVARNARQIAAPAPPSPDEMLRDVARQLHDGPKSPSKTTPAQSRNML
jgi:ADP-ribose pyrophosphatase